MTDYKTLYNECRSRREQDRERIAILERDLAASQRMLSRAMTENRENSEAREQAEAENERLIEDIKQAGKDRDHEHNKLMDTVREMVALREEIQRQHDLHNRAEIARKALYQRAEQAEAREDAWMGEEQIQRTRAEQAEAALKRDEWYRQNKPEAMEDYRLEIDRLRAEIDAMQPQSKDVNQ
jgi:hypothetical protein